MVAMDLKSEIIKLMENRTTLEAEMNTILEQLCQPGGPGLSGNLVDSEWDCSGKNGYWCTYECKIDGFPRSDIDIPVVRANRHRLAVLRNDHRDITEKIGQKIELLHSARLGAKSVTVNESGDIAGSVSEVMRDVSSSSGNSVFSSGVDVDVSRSFAVVDEISEESPAAEDGVQLGDQIVKFGSIEYGDNLLPRLASEAQKNQGRPVPMVIMRQGASINLTVTPRTWQGRGLLGCNFRIL